MGATTLTRGSKITFNHVTPFTYEQQELTGTITAFNYSFERLDALCVDVPGRGNMLVWLEQIN